MTFYPLDTALAMIKLSRMQDFNTVPVFKFAMRSDLNSEDAHFLAPARGSSHATGWDVRAAWSTHQMRTIQPGEYVKIPLGFRVFAPPGWWLELRPRSSTFGKKHLHALYGVIDEDYEGENVFACHLPKSELPLHVEYGEAIGQIIPVRRQEMKVELVSEEEYKHLVTERAFGRGEGGFGSTDKK